MAEDPKLAKDVGVRALEREITCAICHEHYAEPKVLSCCHYYCKQCIHRLAMRTGLDKPFSCPECRKDTTLPQGSVDNLQAAFFINRMKEVHSKLERATGKCELCGEDKAEAFCRQCEQFICVECVRSHQRIKKLFSGHKVVSLEDLKKEGPTNIVVQEQTLPICKEHEEQMKIFCFDCGSLICRDCTIKDHHGHNYEFVKKAALEAKKKLSQQLAPLRGKKESLMRALKETQTSRSEVEAQGKSVARHIEDSFDELQQVLEHRKQQLLTEATSKMTWKMESLLVQEKSLLIACEVVQSVIDYIQQCVEHSADDEIMCMHAELQSRINREIEAQKSEGGDVKPVEEADMAVEVSCVKELKQLCQTKAKITQIPLDPSKCTVTLEKAQEVEIYKTAVCEFTLKASLVDGKPTNQLCQVKCQLKSLIDGSITKCEVKPIRSGEYCVQYTPTVRGHHKLVMTVNGGEVAGSPFPVFVSIHPKKLASPVRVITRLNRPLGVAVFPEGDIVSVVKGNVLALDQRGNRLRSVTQVDHRLKYPRAVAADQNGHVYFVELNNFLIHKTDRQMKTLEVIDDREQTGHLCVAVVKNEVLVCEHGNQGTIKVYSEDLKFVRQIMSPLSSGLFSSLSSDPRGNLYVTDSDNACVHVFSNDRKLLRSFGRDEGGAKKLKTPYGVCVAGQYVYVTDTSYHNVSVFTTEGKYVTSFGQEGSEKGDFDTPIGICMDREGFLYVCDSFNDRIQVF